MKPKTSPAKFLLDRRSAVPALIGQHGDFLIIGGEGNASMDVAALTHQGAHTFGLGGAMGAATMIGLGLALAQPTKRVLVVTGDGDLLMSLGSLATIGVLNPPNLSIVCVDNGRYGLTGNQLSHTSRGVELDKIASAAGIHEVRTVNTEADLADGARALRKGNGTVFVLLRVKEGDAPLVKRNMDAAVCRNRFRTALLGTA